MIRLSFSTAPPGDRKCISPEIRRLQHDQGVISCCPFGSILSIGFRVRNRNLSRLSSISSCNLRLNLTACVCNTSPAKLFRLKCFFDFFRRRWIHSVDYTQTDCSQMQFNSGMIKLLCHFSFSKGFFGDKKLQLETRNPNWNFVTYKCYFLSKFWTISGWDSHLCFLIKTASQLFSSNLKFKW